MLGELTHPDLHLMAYKDDGDFVWFFRELQKLERLKSLVFPVHQLRTEKSLLLPTSDGLSRFFYFDSVTRLTIRIHREWSCYGDKLEFSEAVFMIESAPSLKSLLLQLDVQEECHQLQLTYPRLLVIIGEKPKDEI